MPLDQHWTRLWHNFKPAFSSTAGIVFSLPDDAAHFPFEGQERRGPFHTQQDGQQLGRRLQCHGEHDETLGCHLCLFYAVDIGGGVSRV